MFRLILFELGPLAVSALGAAETMEGAPPAVIGAPMVPSSMIKPSSLILGFSFSLPISTFIDCLLIEKNPDEVLKRKQVLDFLPCVG